MIETRGIRKRFGSQQVLNGVDLRIEPGECVAIIGRSGCGKSILLKHLVGLLHPDEGEVLIHGRDIARLNERELLEVRREFGLLFQSAALFDSLTVFENVAFPLRRQRQVLTEKEISVRVEESLELVDLPGSSHKMPAELSGGMRKRVGLARAIVYRPKALLYDEPTTGLDPVVSDSIDKLVRRLCDQLHVTTIVVTHDMRTVRNVTQRALLLQQGVIYCNLDVASLFASQDPIIHNFVNGISTPKDLAGTL